MSSLFHAIPTPMPLARSFAIAALMGATMLASPLAPARAETAMNSFQIVQALTPKSPAVAAATGSKAETVEQRIVTLHSALKITPEQEPKWAAVAQSMRENVAAMEKQVAETRTKPPQHMTAVDDLQMYQKFAQVHVDGLKNLLSSFGTLYAAMPDAQKKVADGVFQSTTSPSASSRG